MGYYYMTQEGYDALNNTIKQLEAEERPKVTQQIAEARDKGDLSENAEYDAAKEAQAHLEDKIAMLKAQLGNARVLAPSQIKTDEVQILNHVRLLNKKKGEEKSYYIVSDAEANFKENKISVNTPIAKGLLGKKVGDVAEIQVPAGTLVFEILEITR